MAVAQFETPPSVERGVQRRKLRVDFDEAATGPQRRAAFQR